jgi:hypothetical protein
LQDRVLTEDKVVLHITQVAAGAPVVQVLIVQINQTVVQEYITIFQEQDTIGPVAVAVAHTVPVQAVMVVSVEVVEVQ